MRRLLVVGPGPPALGGMASFVQLVVTGTLAEKYDLVFLNTTREPIRRRASFANIRRTMADVRDVWRTARGSDVTHLHSSLGPLLTTVRAGAMAAAARLAGSRVILHVHGGGMPIWLERSTLRRGVFRILLSPVSVVITVAGSAHDLLTSTLPRTCVAHVPNGLDVERFSSAPRSGPRHHGPIVLFAGYLSPRKGLLELFESSAILRARGIVHELWIAGATADDERLEVEDRVRSSAPEGTRFLGAVEPASMPALYAAADVFCLPSWWEAAPMSVLEAMASALPVVATAVGDVPVMVVHGETGLVVAPRDAHDLAEALATLLTDEGRRTELGLAGQKRVATHYDIAATADTIDQLVQRTLGAPHLAAVSE